MSFGANFLPKDPADWTCTNASMTSTEMTLQAGGFISTEITKSQSNGVKSEYLLTIIADKYSSTYAPTIYALLQVTYSDNTYTTFKVPIINTANGICRVVLPFIEGAYDKFTFTIHSGVALTITDWAMAAPFTDYESIVDGIREELPKLLYDYNTSIFSVQQEETTVGFITAELIENTDLNGHAQITYVAKNTCTLYIRIYNNEAQELYTPIAYEIPAGRGSVGIPHAYLNQFVGIHTYLITAQVDKGEISLITRGLMYTIDGGHLAKRLMSIALDVRDLTLRQLAGQKGPDYAYVVGIEDGMARVKRKKIADSAEAIWEPVFEVGPAIDAAIEFNAYWNLPIGAALSTMVTEELPFISWCDPSNILWVQQGTDVSTRTQLATGVTKLSMCRGFKSKDYIQQDQGVVVAYICNGTVCYRAYVPNIEGTSYLWYPEIVCSSMGTNVSHIQVVRLNDYRLGFTVTDGTTGALYVTERCWVGQAMKAEQLKVLDATCTFSLIPLTVHNVEIQESLSSKCYMNYRNSSEADLLKLYEVLDVQFADSDRTVTLTYDCNFYGLDKIVPAEITVEPANTLLSISSLDNTVTATFATPLNKKVPVTLYLKSGEVHYVKWGSDNFLQEPLILEIVPKRDPLDETLSVNATGALLMENTVKRVDILRSETVKCEAISFTMSLTPVGDIPI